MSEFTKGLIDFDQKSLASEFPSLHKYFYSRHNPGLTALPPVAAFSIAFNPIFWKYVPLTSKPSNSSLSHPPASQHGKVPNPLTSNPSTSQPSEDLQLTQSLPRIPPQNPHPLLRRQLPPSMLLSRRHNLPTGPRPRRLLRARPPRPTHLRPHAIPRHGPARLRADNNRQRVGRVFHVGFRHHGHVPG